jgi:serine/threonine-protein kinase
LIVELGARLGPYEILAPVAAGRMGEVYRARDTRLDRTVAIKILPAHVASDPASRQRFEREARAASALDHPHICPIYDVGQHDGIDYLVMPYLDGKTLAALLTRGALPLDQALQHAIEIADALDKAHRAGIVHRDLKPGNVMMTRSGAKLLDFGLAKTSVAQRLSPATGRGAEAHYTTLTTAPAPLTAQGMILGTFPYMAPEQVDGREADPRTDIWAFGCVLYEMLTGRRAFEGSTPASLIAAIFEREPPPLLETVPATTPMLDRLVRRCFAKDPDDRWQTMRDLLEELRFIRDELQRAPDGDRAQVTGSRRVRIVRASAVGVVLLAVLSLWYASRAAAPGAPALARFALALPHTIASGNPWQPALALSPDGRRLVYVGVGAGGVQLFMRAFDQLDPIAVSGGDGAVAPFFSPDGQWIGFASADGKLRKVPVGGGSPIVICDAPDMMGASWASDGTIVFASPPPDRGSGPILWRVSESGGQPLALTHLKGTTSSAQRWPELLPGGKAVVFTEQTARLQTDVLVVVRLDTGERRVLIEDGRGPHYVPTGHLIFSRTSTILAVPFDLETLQVKGSPAPVIEGVLTTSGSGAAHIAVSAQGTVAYIPGASAYAPTKTLAWIDRHGGMLPISAPPRRYQHPRLSPTGDRVAVTIRDGLGSAAGTDIWLYHFARGTLTRFTYGPAENELSVWTRDGARIAYASNRLENPSRTIFWKPADGSGPEERLLQIDRHLHPASWSPDGNLLVASESGSAPNYDIWVIPAHGDRKPWPLAETPFKERTPDISPDGRSIAFASNETGRWEVYVQAFPNPGGRVPISTNGGTEPRWSSDGRELFFIAGDRMMVAAIHRTADHVDASAPKALFDLRWTGGAGTSGRDLGYDVTGDGQRFLMLREQSPGATLNTIVVTQNWFSELQRLVPSR